MKYFSFIYRSFLSSFVPNHIQIHPKKYIFINYSQTNRNVVYGQIIGISINPTLHLYIYTRISAPHANAPHKPLSNPENKCSNYTPNQWRPMCIHANHLHI